MIWNRQRPDPPPRASEPRGPHPTQHATPPPPIRRTVVDRGIEYEVVWDGSSGRSLEDRFRS